MEWSIALGQRCSYSAHLTKYPEILSGYTTLQRKNRQPLLLVFPVGSGFALVLRLPAAQRAGV